MPEPVRFATAPRYIRAVDFGHLLVLINYRDGGVHCLPPPGAALWNRAAQFGRVHDLPSSVTSKLLSTGVLIQTPGAVPWTAARTALSPVANWGGSENPAGLETPPRQPLAVTIAAGTALATVTAIQHAGNPVTAMYRVMRLIHQSTGTGRRPATLAQARAAVRAVRRAGRYSAVRAACLEETAAATILLAACRLQVTWCHGLAADPVRMHAWLQTNDGAPVEEPLSTQLFTPTLTLGVRDQR